MPQLPFRAFDADHHYYEAEDAFTRHVDPRLHGRAMQWAVVNGKKRLLVGGKVNRFIPNPTFDPVARPGCLDDYYQGKNKAGSSIRDAFGELEPISPAYRNRDARIAVMDRQRMRGAFFFPTLGVGMEEALAGDPEAVLAGFRAFHRGESYDGPYKGEKSWRNFVEAVKARMPGVKIGIYTANWWWSRQSVSDPAYWASYPLWVAQYILNPADVAIPSPWAAKGCVLWQYTSHGDGSAYGAESANIDLNKWNGSLDSFFTFFNLGKEPPQMPIGTYEVVSQTYTMSLRQDHAVTATKLESVAAGTVMVADDIWTAPADGNYVKAGDQWAHVVKVNGVTKNAWVAG